MQNVFILLFNARTENEGIHTLSVNGSSSGRAREIVLAFEAEDDATRFALLLEAQDFPTPTVEKIDRLEVEEFCQSNGYELRFIPEGVLEIPPPTNLEHMSWSADRRPPVADGADVSGEGLGPKDASPSSADLDLIRQQLERLL